MKYRFIDLFAGAGGLSEGFIRAGYEPIAHIEMDHYACDSLKTRAAFHFLKENGKLEIYEEYLKNKKEKTDGSWLWNQVPKSVIDSVIQEAIGKETLPSLFERVDKLCNGKPVDVIIGGPPCQAYSVAGRARFEKIKTDDKENYLIGQKELLDDDSNINTDELKTLAYNLFLINPTWKNVISYYNNKNKDENILIKYIEHFSDNLGNQMIEKDDSEYSSLGAYLLGTTKLTIGTYSSIIKSFEIEFEGYDGLRRLDRDRLLLLLSHNMLPFCEENTDLLKEMDIYADYLIKYHKQLLENLSASYISDCAVAYKILSSEVFTYEQKKRIISITPKDILIELDKLANQVLDIIINTDFKNIEEETIIEVLENASNESYRVYIISLLILEYDYDDNKIAELLSLLGGKYIDIAERSKHPVLKETKWNIKLAGALKHKRFISSAKEDKDGIRIYPKR